MKYMPLNGRLIFKWKKTFMLTSYRSTFRDVVELKDGSFLIYVSDVVKSDNNDDECNSCIKYDIFIKLDSYGNFISESKMVSNIWGNSYMVGPSKDGDIYIYGADVDKRNGFEGTKFIINKLNIDNHLVKVKNFINFSGYYYHSLEITNDNNILISSSICKKWYTDIDFPYCELNESFIVSKISRTGNVIYEKKFNRKDFFESIYFLKELNNENVIFFAKQTNKNNSSDNYFISRILDKYGNLIITREYSFDESYISNFCRSYSGVFQINNDEFFCFSHYRISKHNIFGKTQWEKDLSLEKRKEYNIDDVKIVPYDDDCALVLSVYRQNKRGLYLSFFNY